MIQPNSLQKGDTIGIISTARKISYQELTPAIKKFEDWGLNVHFGRNLFEEFNQFAGTDNQRAADLQEMIDNPDIKAIICARGGYGTVRIIDKINFKPLKKSPKWIVGYSDVTVLHSHLHSQEFETIHATMPINFPEDGSENQAVNTLYQALFTGKLHYEFTHGKFNKDGHVLAPVIGGNLSILYSLIGSKSDISTSGKIVFFEDLDEYLYHVDRMMMNLKRNGKFDSPAAILIGGLSDMNDNLIPFGMDAYEIANQILADVNCPVFFNFPAGHQPDNRAIILGRNAEIFSKNNKVIFNQ